MLAGAEPIWAGYTALLERRGVDLYAVQMNPDAHRDLFQLSEALIDFDERFQRFRYDHLKLVQRVIGGGTSSLKGIPAEILEGSLRHRFFPELWDVRERIFAEFTPGSVDV